MNELPHYGQILTDKETILSYCRDIALPVAENTVRIIVSGLKTQDDYLRLYATCARLYYLSKLVYMDELAGKVSKLSLDEYRKEIFEPHAETDDEVWQIIVRTNKSDTNLEPKIRANVVDRTFRCLTVIEKLWCGAIACLWEQIYIPELAYEFNYVLRNEGRLSDPVFDGIYSLYPSNYPDRFDPWDDGSDNITKYFENNMGSIF